LQRAFPLVVLMVPTSVITDTINSERLTCGGFSLGEMVCLGNIEFITDYFSGMSLSPGGATQASPSWAQLTSGLRPSGMS
jgi:hypothetical protein